MRCAPVLLALLAGCATAGPSVIQLADNAPDAAGSVHTEFSLPGVGGLPLFAQAWRPASGDPKAVLVIVHGLKDHSARYAAFADAAVQRGYAVWALDLRGHGRSAGDRVVVDSFDDYLGDLELFLDGVRHAEAGKPIFLFGHSMGGCIVTLDVLRNKPALAGLILSGPAIEPTDDVGGFLIGSLHVLGTLTPGLPVLDLPNANFSRDPQTAAEMDKDPLVYQGKGPANTANELLNAMKDVRAHWDELDVPLLDMHGTADKLTNPQGSKDLVAHAKTADKTLKLYEGLYHDLLHEPERATVTADVLAWMDAHTH